MMTFPPVESSRVISTSCRSPMENSETRVEGIDVDSPFLEHLFRVGGHRLFSSTNLKALALRNLWMNMFLAMVKERIRLNSWWTMRIPAL